METSSRGRGDLRTEAAAFDQLARDAEAVSQSTNAAPVAGFSLDAGGPAAAARFTTPRPIPTTDELTVTWDFGDGTPRGGHAGDHDFAPARGT